MQRIVFLAVFILTSGPAAAALEKVEVTFSSAEALTDLQIGSSRGEDVRSEFARAVERFFLSSAARGGRSGKTLELEFHDVDMAGEVQPWRSRDGRYIRYVEIGYPARVHFSFRLLDADGNRLDSGEARVREIPFKLTSVRLRNRPFAYELEALREWWRQKR